MSEQEPNNQDSIRAQLTTKIWGCAVGMLGISIPLSAIVGHAGNGGGFAAVIIPLSVIGGAAVSTMAIWNPFSARRKESPAQDTGRVAELEERVASLEMILSYEEKLLESKMRQEATMSQQPMLSESSLPIDNDFSMPPASASPSPKPRRRTPKAKREVAETN